MYLSLLWESPRPLDVPIIKPTIYMMAHGHDLFYHDIVPSPLYHDIVAVHFTITQYKSPSPWHSTIPSYHDKVQFPFYHNTVVTTHFIITQYKSHLSWQSTISFYPDNVPFYNETFPNPFHYNTVQIPFTMIQSWPFT